MSLPIVLRSLNLLSMLDVPMPATNDKCLPLTTLLTRTKRLGIAIYPDRLFGKEVNPSSLPYRSAEINVLQEFLTRKHEPDMLEATVVRQFYTNAGNSGPRLWQLYIPETNEMRQLDDPALLRPREQPRPAGRQTTSDMPDFIPISSGTDSDVEYMGTRSRSRRTAPRPPPHPQLRSQQPPPRPQPRTQPAQQTRQQTRAQQQQQQQQEQRPRTRARARAQSIKPLPPASRLDTMSSRQLRSLVDNDDRVVVGITYASADRDGRPILVTAGIDTADRLTFRLLARTIDGEPAPVAGHSSSLSFRDIAQRGCPLLGPPTARYRIPDTTIKCSRTILVIVVGTTG